MDKGIFITFEGIDGSGKSTQIEMLKEYLIERGHTLVVTREPGGNIISEKIRNIILDKDLTMMSPVTEMLLYAAARAQIVSEIIRPALEEGNIVICDRFLDSSIAYQGYGRGLGEMVCDVNEIAVEGVMPDRTFLLQIPPEEGRARLEGELDRLEMEDLKYFNSVYRGYEEIVANNPHRLCRLDAMDSVDEIHKCIINEVERLFVEKNF